METENSTESSPSRYSKKGWLLLLIPLLLLGATVVFLLQPKVEMAKIAEVLMGEQISVGEITIEAILVPAPGVIQVEVVNGSAEEVTFPQVLVDDAYWDFEAKPSNTLPSLGKATFTIPYPWVEGELHVVRLITSHGATYDGEIVVSSEITSTAATQ